MKIQRFEGRNSEEALRLAQMALGPDAVVLQTRRIEDTGMWRLVRRPRVEVLVAVDASPKPARPPATPDQGRRLGRPGERPAAREPQPPPRNQAPAPGWQDEMAALRREMANLRDELGQPERTPVRPEKERVTRAESATKGRLGAVAAPAARPKSAEKPRGVDPVPPPEEIVRRMRDGLTTRTIELHDGESTLVCLVGPTGVGKTTTLAKLAAVAQRVEGRRVAFITVDTFRVGAVEQLETYARLLDVPLTVAYTSEDVQAARASYAKYDLVLVDTVGRSALNAPQLEDQAALLALANPDEVHLVLSASGSYASHESVMRGFRALRPTHLLLTKLDEAPRLDDVMAAALGGGLPLSYVATGQRVPEDLAPADCKKLAGWLLGGQ